MDLGIGNTSYIKLVFPKNMQVKETFTVFKLETDVVPDGVQCKKWRFCNCKNLKCPESMQTESFSVVSCEKVELPRNIKCQDFSVADSSIEKMPDVIDAQIVEFFDVAFMYRAVPKLVNCKKLILMHSSKIEIPGNLVLDRLDISRTRSVAVSAGAKISEIDAGGASGIVLPDNMQVEKLNMSWTKNERIPNGLKCKVLVLFCAENPQWGTGCVIDEVHVKDGENLISIPDGVKVKSVFVNDKKMSLDQYRKLVNDRKAQQLKDGIGVVRQKGNDATINLLKNGGKGLV